jgi:hypothetical protein
MVNRKRNYTWHFLLMAVMTAVAIGVINYLAMEHRVRVDLTEDQRFTLSEGTERLFEKLPDAITVTYYVSEEPPPKRINLERDVRDKLEELAVSSGGKLEYRVERISKDETATKREELQKKNIVDVVDVETQGAVDIKSYFSSLEVRYGAAEPKAINGIVNLVDKADEAREHRVDTLEFDIAYAVLTMRNSKSRPPFERLLKSFENPLRVTYYVTEEMPDQYKTLAVNIETAIKEIAQLAPDKVLYQRVNLPLNPRTQNQPDPFGGDDKSIQPFQARRELVPTADGRMQLKETYYFAHVFLEPNSDRQKMAEIPGFEDKTAVSDLRTAIEDMIWEKARPRSRLGFVLPPEDPSMRDPRQQPQPGQPPTNGHTPLMQFIQAQLEYETVWVDLATEKRVPRDLACLIVLEANMLKERELYEIERYLAEGGNVVMMVQGWSTNLEISGSFASGVILDKVDTQPHFEEWAKHIGVEFGSELLLRENSRLQPYQVVGGGFQRRVQPIDTAVKLAPIVEPQDLNTDSVFTRGLASLSLPLPVETKVSDERLDALDLQRTDLITLEGGAYRFLPKSQTAPEIPFEFGLQYDSRIENNPDAEVDMESGVLAQRSAEAPAMAVLLSGEFPSFWADEKRKLPGWSGDPEEQDAPAVANRRKGNLLLMSSAGMLNIKYAYGYGGNEWGNVVVPTGIALYRNIAEAFIYGDDLVSLRARTGIAPRIVGPVSDNTRVAWYLACLGGVPLFLALLGAGRGYLRNRERDQYNAAFTGGGE